jgi:polyferredoxin
MGYETGLIKYTTEHAMEGGKTKILRPRIVIYAVILLAIISAFIYSFSQRISLGLDVIRDRNTLYRETGDGLIENVYILKILNMDDAGHKYDLSVSGIPGLTLHKDMAVIRVESGGIMELPVRLRADEGDLEARSSDVVFELVATDDDSLAVSEDARFLGPR